MRVRYRRGGGGGRCATKGWEDRPPPMARFDAVAGKTGAEAMAGLHDGPGIERDRATQRRGRRLRQYGAGERAAFADSRQDGEEILRAAMLTLQLATEPFGIADQLIAGRFLRGDASEIGVGVDADRQCAGAGQRVEPDLIGRRPPSGALA